MIRNPFIAVSSAFLVVVVTTHICSAAPIIVTNSSAGAFPVSNSDLLEGIVGTVGPGSLGGQEGTSNNPATLTNGTFGAAGLPNAAALAETVSIGNNTTITWQLDLGASAAGYDITGVNVYSGWRDGGRDRQDYTARYATVADPGNFVDIASIAGFNPSPSASGESLITDDTGLIASGVGEIQLFFPGQENGYSGYREIDVLGSAVAGPAVPEPASIAIWSLLGLCLAGYGYRRRRNS